MTKKTKKYEVICFFSPSLNQEKLDKAVQKVKDIISKSEESSIEENKSPVLQKLAYPINKNQEAFHLILNASLIPESIENIKNELNTENDLIRYLISNKKEIDTKPQKTTFNYDKMIEKIEPFRQKKSFEQELKTDDKAPVEKHTEKKDKAKIEDLDKKLEEILNE